MKTRTMLACLAALQLPPTAFAQDIGIQVEVLGQSTASWDGAALPIYPAGQPEVTVLRYRIPGNTVLPWHSHPIINAGVLLSGRLTVVTRDGERLLLEAGDSIIETVGTWHQGMNEHDEPAELIVFYAGVAGTPLTLQEE